MADVTVVIDADNKGFTQKMKQVSDSTDDATKKTHKLGGALADMGKIAGGIVLSQGLMKLPGLFTGMISGASDLNESLSKVRTVFGTASADIEKFASSAAKSMGMTKQAALEATGTFGNFLQAMGATTPQAAEMSKGMVKLAADLGSFNNVDPTEVLLALRSGLSGEAEPMRRFGVALSETAVKAKAAEMGIKALGGELTEQQKIAVRYAIIMEQTATAQGDFDRTSGGLANSMKILKSMWGDASAQLGTALLPGIVALAQAAIQLLPTVIALGQAFGGKLKEGLQAIAPAITEVAKAVGGFVWDKLRAFGSWVSGTLIPVLQKLGAEVLAKLREGLEFVAVQAQRLADIVINSEQYQRLVDALNQLKVSIADLRLDDFAAAWQKVEEKIKPAVDALRPLVDQLLASLKSLIVDVSKALEPLLDAIKKNEEALKLLAYVVGTVIVLALGAFLLAMTANTEFIRFVLLSAITAVTVAFNALDIATEAVKRTFELAKEAFDRLKAVLDDLRAAAAGVGTAFVVLGGAVVAALGPVIATINALVSGYEKITGLIGGGGSRPLDYNTGGPILNTGTGGPTLGGGGFTPSLDPFGPGFASGGYIPATPGGRMIRVGEGGEGEFVIPKSKMPSRQRGGGGNIYITMQNVNASTIADAQRAANDVGFGLQAALSTRGIA